MFNSCLTGSSRYRGSPVLASVFIPFVEVSGVSSEVASFHVFMLERTLSCSDRQLRITNTTNVCTEKDTQETECYWFFEWHRTFYFLTSCRVSHQRIASLLAFPHFWSYPCYILPLLQSFVCVQEMLSLQFCTRLLFGLNCISSDGRGHDCRGSD